MSDLISRQAAIEHLKHRLYETELNSEAKYPYYAEMADNRVSVWLEEVPTIEPKRGKWIKDDVGVHCSECFCGWDFLTGIPVEVYGFHYCPNCGEKMERREE